jgi:hypothetical protein
MRCAYCVSTGIAVYSAHAVAHGKAIPFLMLLELLHGYFGIGPPSSAPRCDLLAAGGRESDLGTNAERHLMAGANPRTSAPPTLPAPTTSPSR